MIQSASGKSAALPPHQCYLIAVLHYEIYCGDNATALLLICISREMQQCIVYEFIIAFSICSAVLLIFIREMFGNIDSVSKTMIIAVCAFDGRFHKRALYFGIRPRIHRYLHEVGFLILRFAVYHLRLQLRSTVVVIRICVRLLPLSSLSMVRVMRSLGYLEGG